MQERSLLFSFVSHVHCVYANMQLSLSTAFYVWALLSSLPQFPRTAQMLCDALKLQSIFYFIT